MSNNKWAHAWRFGHSLSIKGLHMQIEEGNSHVFYFTCRGLHIVNQVLEARTLEFAKKEAVQMTVEALEDVLSTLKEDKEDG